MKLCNAPGCTHPRETNLLYCRGHEGGFEAPFFGKTEAALKVKTRALKVVWVEIRGVPHPDGFPYVPNDYGLVGRFGQWCVENECWSVIRAGHTGGGSFAGGFDPRDLKRIAAFFKQEGYTLEVE